MGLFAAAFLLGTIPFAYLLTRLALGVDVRRHGSGNPGATNAARLWPKPWRLPVFVLVFLLDATKGFLAVALLPGFFAAGPAWVPLAAGLAAVLGHVFNPFFRFRGGKGVSTTLGVLLALDPLATLAALAVFALVYACTRTVAAGSLGVAIALPIAVFFHGRAHPGAAVLALVLGALIVVRHRENIVRGLRRGEP